MDNNPMQAMESQAGCPCKDPAWCQPLPGPATRRSGGELFGFIGSTSYTYSQFMNWTWITTIAWGNDELTCLAHQHGVKSVIGAPPIDLNLLGTSESRLLWAQQALAIVQSKFRDGIVFDYESPASGELALRYAALVETTALIFRNSTATSNVHYQISTCIPWSPANIDGRDYPWRELALHSDLLYVMDYDTRSQVTTEGFCLAGPNAPYAGMVQAMEQWRSVLGDDGLRQSVILGVPWYGYRYECLPGTTAWDARYCPIRHVPFRGVNCSDAAGSEVAYSKITMDVHPVTPTRRGESQSPYVNAVENGAVVQYWYDDPVSLRRKFEWARTAGLAGIGPFSFHYVAGCSPKLAADIWETFDAYFLKPESGTAAVVDEAR